MPNFVRLNNGGFVPEDHPDVQKYGVSTDQSGVPAPTPGSAPAPITATQTKTTTDPGTAGTGASAGQALSAPAPAGGTIAQGTPTTAAGAFQQALVNRLTAPVPTAQSASIAPAIEANKLAQQRGMERSRALLAEKAAGQGTSLSGGNNAALLGLNQQRAQAEGQFAGNAVMQAAQQQANELTQALALTGNMLSDQDRMAMQERLAQLQATIQREQLKQTGELGGQELALRGELGRGNLNLGLLSALLQNNQYNSGLGLQAGIAGANLNQNALLSLLGAL